tara:strand:+ start:15134 stop:16054 length:921 start_codon:yes stop_codon:yes gene_type:complete
LFTNATDPFVFGFVGSCVTGLFASWITEDTSVGAEATFFATLAGLFVTPTEAAVDVFFTDPEFALVHTARFVELALRCGAGKGDTLSVGAIFAEFTTLFITQLKATLTVLFADLEFSRKFSCLCRACVFFCVTGGRGWTIRDALFINTLFAGVTKHIPFTLSPVSAVFTRLLPFFAGLLIDRLTGANLFGLTRRTSVVHTVGFGVLFAVVVFDTIDTSTFAFRRISTTDLCVRTIRIRTTHTLVGEAFVCRGGVRATGCVFDAFDAASFVAIGLFEATIGCTVFTSINDADIDLSTTTHEQNENGR